MIISHDKDKKVNNFIFFNYIWLSFFIFTCIGCVKYESTNSSNQVSESPIPTQSPDESSTKIFNRPEKKVRHGNVYRFRQSANVFDTSSYFELDISPLRSKSHLLESISIADSTLKNKIILNENDISKNNVLKLHLSKHGKQERKVEVNVRFKNGQKKTIEFNNMMSGVLQL